MDLDRAKNRLQDGYCLWVGAGVTKQLWPGAPQWGELTKKLEALAELGDDCSLQYPERLGRCSDKLGSDLFRKHLRKIYYTDLCEALLRRAAQSLEDGGGIPPESRKVAALGQLANPIVSFNIEPFSSTLPARSAGPARIIPFINPQTQRIEFREFVKTFQRIVYHPHGLSTVDCIMTEKDYENLDGTLAFELAVHTAFGNHLAIVGMSLQEEYLRKQIQKFRSQIDSITWFNSQFGDLEIWARCNQVEMVWVEWSKFWDAWSAADVPEKDLMIACCRVVDAAAEELSGGRAYGMAQLISDDFLRNKMLEYSTRIGEPGELRLVDGQAPSDICRRFRELLRSKNIRIPAALNHPHGV